jgi:predicted alpha/beta hydrolase family esterase
MFNSNILIHPGLGNSGPTHWQTLWEREYGFPRVEQRDWETPDRTEWTTTLNNYVSKYDPGNLILVVHSLACITTAYWAQQYNINIKAALLVAPSDTEAENYPQGTTGFKPVPLFKLPFPSIVVTSSDDYYVTVERATQFATAWGSELINVGKKGHINVASGYGEWDEGLEILKRLDSK